MLWLCKNLCAQLHGRLHSSTPAVPTAALRCLAWVSAVGLGGLCLARGLRQPLSITAGAGRARCQHSRPSGLPPSPSFSFLLPSAGGSQWAGGGGAPLGPRGRGGAGAGGGGRTRRGGAREAGRGSAAAGTGARHRRPVHGPRPAALRPAAAGGARWPPTGAAGSWGCGCWRRRGCAAGWRRASPPAATKCGRRFSCGRSGPSSWSPTCPRPVSTDPPAGWLLRAGGCGWRGAVLGGLGAAG